MIKFENEDVILKMITGILMPFALVLGIYVILNGHISPGGGFSGGTILGAVLILHSITYGPEKTRKFFSMKVFTNVTVITLLIYGALKGYSFMTGAAHIPTGIPIGTLGNILSGGLILPLNIGVGILVACTVYALYSLFNEGEV